MVGSQDMVTLRSETASQLRREPGRQIHPIEVLITSAQSLVVLSHMMKMMFPKETERIRKGNRKPDGGDGGVRMEETTEMWTEMEVGTMTHHLLPCPRKVLIVQRRTKRRSKREVGMETVGMIPIRILKTVMISLSDEWKKSQWWLQHWEFWS